MMQAAVPLIEFRNVSFQIAGKAILSGVDLTVQAGETLVLLGRSGSGKTTALKLANGMLFPSRGQVLVEGTPTTEWDPIRLKRRFGYVIQDAGLFPHWSVRENVGLIPKLEGWPPEKINGQVRRLLSEVGLPPDEFLPRAPRQLSGGQRQRVGIARALAADPPMLLFDEPFGALDPVTRLELQQQFLALRRDFQRTSLFVTHDVREALRLATRIVLLRDGRVDCAASATEFRAATSEEARAFLEGLSV